MATAEMEAIGRVGNPNPVAEGDRRRAEVGEAVVTQDTAVIDGQAD